jgi:Tfp pilus assembly protein PilO
MISASPALVFTGILIAMLLMVVGMCFLARKAGIDGEKAKQAEANAKNAIKQKEIANVQTEIAAKKTDDFDVNVDRLKQLSRRSPRTNK